MWPGNFPNQPTDYLTVNVRTDDFPQETTIAMYVLNDDGGFDYVGGINLNDTYTGEDQEEAYYYPGTLYGFDVPVLREKIYKLEFSDFFGDGICCVYGRDRHTAVQQQSLASSPFKSQVL